MVIASSLLRTKSIQRMATSGRLASRVMTRPLPPDRMRRSKYWSPCGPISGGGTVKIGVSPSGVPCGWERLKANAHVLQKLTVPARSLPTFSSVVPLLFVRYSWSSSRSR